MGGAGFNKATVAAIRGTGIERTAHIGGALRHTAQQDDGAVVLLHRARFDDAGVVDHAGKQCVFGARAHQDIAAVGADQPAVFGQAVQYPLVHLHLDHAVVLERKGGGTTCPQCHCAQRRGDRALVADGVAEQGDVTTRAARACGIDCALVDDAAGTGAAERSAAAIQAGVIDAERGGHQCADVNQRVLPEQDAVGVDQVHLPVGVEAPEDLCAVGVEDAVDCDGGCRRLHEVDRLLRCNIEAVPVEREVLAGLIDGGGRPGLGDAARAGAHLPAHGFSLREGRQEQAPRQRHGAGQQSPAGAGLAPPFGVFCHRHQNAQRTAPDQAVDTVH